MHFIPLIAKHASTHRRFFLVLLLLLRICGQPSRTNPLPPTAVCTLAFLH